MKNETIFKIHSAYLTIYFLISLFAWENHKFVSGFFLGAFVFKFFNRFSELAGLE